MKRTSPHRHTPRLVAGKVVCPELSAEAYAIATRSQVDGRGQDRVNEEKILREQQHETGRSCTGTSLWIVSFSGHSRLTVESIRTFCGEAFFFIILETREVALLKDSSSSSSLVGCCFSTCFECLVVMLPVKRATSVLHDRNPSHPSLTHFIILVHWLLSTLLQIFLYYSCSAAASNLETFPLCLTADNDACLNHYQIFNFLKWFFGLVETKTWAKSRLAIFWIQFKC